MIDDKDGFRCRTCNCGHFIVIWVRHRRGAIVRCKECRHCGRRVRTMERIEEERNKDGTTNVG